MAQKYLETALLKTIEEVLSSIFVWLAIAVERLMNAKTVIRDMLGIATTHNDTQSCCSVISELDIVSDNF